MPPVAKYLLIAATVMPGSVALAADVATGKSVSQAQCVQCHEPDDWDGEDSASLESLIRDIVAGKVKHKTKIALSPEQIAAIAAYWAQAGKKR